MNDIKWSIEEKRTERVKERCGCGYGRGRVCVWVGGWVGGCS